MAPSPRNNAPTFNPTWNATDAAFLDPSSLPIAKVPRAWERKQEKKITVGGKQRTVWRRYTTRSQAKDVATEEEEEEAEVHDARTRAVKRRQHMSPEAMEKASKLRLGKKRVFKATRWERRKSVLPRKNATRLNPNIEDPEDADRSDDAQDATDVDASNTSFSEIAVEDATRVPTLVPDKKDRRATFTFSMEDDQSEPRSDSPEREPTLVNFFRSPDKNASPAKVPQPSKAVEYPDLPQLPEAEVEMVDVGEEEQVESTVVEVKASVEPSPIKVHVQEGDVEHEIPTPLEKSPHAEEAFFDEELQSTDSAVEISYPYLLEGETEEQMVQPEKNVPERDEGMSELAADFVANSDEVGDDLEETEDKEEFIDEEFTEASIQLDIERAMAEEPETSVTVEEKQESAVAYDEEMESALPAELSAKGQAHDAAEPLSTLDVVDDIADGLTLGTPRPVSREPTPRKLRSPSPPPVEHDPENTMTVALDDDTAMLKDFLSRAAASRASKAATISRRESVQNRRDSDVVRHALASPRKVLEDKDPNSPSKYDNDATLDLSQTLTLSMPHQPLSPTQEQADTEGTSETAAKSSRRSSRTRKSRLPAPSSTQATGPSKIAVRRAGGDEPIVLKKSDAQELSQLTRTNTRKNKQGAFSVNIRLLTIANDRPASKENTTASMVQVPEKKYVRWDEQLAYYQEGTDTMANMLADAESLASPDELSLPAPAVAKKAKVVKEKASSSTPKIRRVRGLGATNGTPGKMLMTPGSLLPDTVQAEKESSQTQPARLPKAKTKTSKVKKMPVASASASMVDTIPAPISAALEARLPTLEVAPVGIETSRPAPVATKERKSRLATPKKVKLPQPSTAAGVVGEGKENQGRAGIAAATPKKGIPVSSSTFGVVGGMTAGAETGLPRRRGRKI